MEKQICIYHSADLDGQSSGAVVKHFNPDAEMIGHDYGWPFDVEDLAGAEVILVDLSFPMDTMKRIKEIAAKFIWIDHHKTAIEEAEAAGFKTLGSLVVGRGACELAWNYFSNDAPLPLALWLLSKYDVWDHTDERVVPFQYGCRVKAPKWHSNEWWKLFHNNAGLVLQICEIGSHILKYEEEKRAKTARSLAFTDDLVLPTGEKFSACIINTLDSSPLFKSVYSPGLHNLMICYAKRGDGKIKFTLYSDQPLIDAGYIAQQFGGGGHKGAAGFELDYLPFATELEKDSKNYFVSGLSEEDVQNFTRMSRQTRPVALSFTLKGQDLSKIEKRLALIASYFTALEESMNGLTEDKIWPKYEVVHCFLPREAVIERGLPTELVDLLDQYFPGNKSFYGETGQGLEADRQELAQYLQENDGAVIIIGAEVEGVAIERELYDATLDPWNISTLPNLDEEIDVFRYINDLGWSLHCAPGFKVCVAFEDVPYVGMFIYADDSIPVFVDAAHFYKAAEQTYELYDESPIYAEGDEKLTELKWEKVRKKPIEIEVARIEGRFRVQTLEGIMTGADALLAKGVKGELYPIRTDIFEQTYEPVTESNKPKKKKA